MEYILLIWLLITDKCTYILLVIFLNNFFGKNIIIIIFDAIFNTKIFIMRKLCTFCIVLLGIMFFIQEVGAQGGTTCNDAVVVQVGENIADNTGSVDQWFKYTATSNGKITLSTCGYTSEDTYVEVFESCQGMKIAESDDFCGPQSKVLFPVNKGETYYLNWPAFNTSGAYTFNIEESSIAVGELCSNPIVATIGDNSFTGQQGESQWFSYTAMQSGKLTVSACGNTADNVKVMISTNCSEGNWEEPKYAEGCEDKEVIISVEAGATYYIEWINNSSSDVFTFSINEEQWAEGEHCSNPTPAIEGNNNFTPALYEGYGSIRYYSYKATKNGKIVISHFGKADYCVVEIRSRCIDIRKLDDIHTQLQLLEMEGSELSFSSTAGNDYIIYYYSESNNTDFTWSLAEEDPIEGESCYNAYKAEAGTNAFTADSYKSQWFSYQAKKTGKMLISSVNSKDYLGLSIYDNCGKESFFKTASFDEGENVHAAVKTVSGNTYYIRWDNQSPSTNRIDWTINEQSEEQGDFCSNPKQAIVGDNNNCDHSIGVDQWFTYTATQNGQIIISSCSLTDEDTYLVIYDDCNKTWIAENDDYCDYQAGVVFDCEAGETFLIRWSNWFYPGAYDWSLTESGTTDINTQPESDNNELTIYPNPAKNEINIRSSNRINQLKIYNLVGKVVVSKTEVTDKLYFNLMSGLYFIEIELEDGQVHKQKLLIK